VVFLPKASRPAPSPERAALAGAIAQRDAVASEVAAIRAAVEAARAASHAAQQARAAAETGIATAKAAAGQHLTDAAMGTAGARPPDIRAARAALLAADDDCEVTQIAVDALATRLAEAERAEPAARLKVESAALACVRASPEAARLLADTERLQRELFANAAALTHLHRIGGLDRAMPGANPNATSTPADLAAARLASPVSTWHALATESREPAWRAWLEALSTDADAMLAP
jgi:hypothetical protein